MNSLTNTLPNSQRSRSLCSVFKRCLPIIVLTGLLAGSAQGGLILSFAPTNSSITIGQTVDIDLILTQTDPAIVGADITTNGVVQADVELLLDSTAATVSGFSFGTGFEDAFSDISDPFAPLLSAQSTDFVNGVTSAAGSPTSLTIGTYTFTGNSVGTTTATTFDTGFTDFVFAGSPFDDFDNQIFGAESTVITVTAVPEPGTFAMFGVAMLLAIVVRRKKKLAVQ